MSTGARGFTIVRASEVAATASARIFASSELAASEVAWELAARARFERALASAHDALAMLAFDVAEGIIGHAVTVDGTTLDAMVSQALARARGARRMLVCVHPADLDDAVRATSAALPDGARVEWIDFAPDPALTRGTVAIETERGRVTADWAQSLALARARWQASLREPKR